MSVAGRPSGRRAKPRAARAVCGRLERQRQRVPFDTRPLIGERDGWSGTTLRLSGGRARRRAATTFPLPLTLSGIMPGWVTAPAAAWAEPAQTARAVAAERAPNRRTLSPLAISRRDRFKRGLHRAPAAEEPARIRGARARSGGAAVFGAAAARDRRGRPGGDLRRDASGPERPGPSQSCVGTRCPGRGAGRRADPGVEPRDRACSCPDRSTASS